LSRDPLRPLLLMTGGNGFVGGHLAPVLAARFPGHRRIMLTQSGRTAQPDWEAVAGDLTDEPGIDQLIKTLRPATVVHLAAQASVGQAASAAEATWRVNFGGSFALAAAAARHAPGGVFLFSSTAEVYGASFRNGPASEATTPAPGNAYAASKLAAELMLQSVLPAATRLIIARAFNHSGAGQDERFVLPSFAAQIARIEAGMTAPRLLVGNLAAERDFLHVADVVDAYVGLLMAAGRLAPCTLVNVASGRAVKIEALLGRLQAMSQTPFEIVADPGRMRPSDIPRAVGDAGRLHALTGWSPQRGLDDMLHDVLQSQRARTGPPVAKD
jgi:GDP-4-dehydro-6-deoxy-D-mannose reductase